ncbi:MAG: DUF123 domain-containing protein [Promethearchaeota archaeon]
MKGSYILVIYIPKNIEIIIGALGRILFNVGYYLYVGSGMGINGSATLENRVKRHLLPSNNKKIHWHIDYLLNNENSFIIKIYIIPSLVRLECIIAAEIDAYSEKNVKDFGSSDCRCNSHLFYFKEFERFDYLKN